MNLKVIIAALIVGLSIGWFSRGAKEAERTAEAIEKAVRIEAAKWQEQMRIATEAAEAEVKIVTQTEVVEKEVIKYVQSNTDNRVCFTDNELQYITEISEAP
jgi:hypothetical protein